MWDDIYAAMAVITCRINTTRHCGSQNLSHKHDEAWGILLESDSIRKHTEHWNFKRACQHKASVPHSQVDGAHREGREAREKLEARDWRLGPNLELQAQFWLRFGTGIIKTIGSSGQITLGRPLSPGRKPRRNPRLRMGR